MKVLVAGGAGFIGSHLCQALFEKGDEVICVDNLITGRKENIKEFINNPRFEFVSQDVIKEGNKVTMKQGNNVNFIYHLASPASPKQYQKYPIETLLANSVGTYHLLNLAKKTGAKFLFASSSEVYGEPKEHPQMEGYWGNVNPIGPRSCYDEGKRFGEAMVMAFIRKYGVDARIVRIFNTYGPKMEKNDGRVISNFVNQALSGKLMTVYGQGNQTRSFCYVTDIVKGLIKAMESENTKGQVFNLGNPDERSVLEIARLIKKMTKSWSKIVFTDLPEDDPSRRKPDIEKAKRILGWTPKVKLEQGLKETIRYLQSLL